MANRSKHTLFLMEQLVVILVFAICAAVTVRIFVGSFLMAENAKHMKNALLIAESVAEVYKATDGDLTEMLKVLEIDEAYTYPIDDGITFFLDNTLTPAVIAREGGNTSSGGREVYVIAHEDGILRVGDREVYRVSLIEEVHGYLQVMSLEHSPPIVQHRISILRGSPAEEILSIPVAALKSGGGMR